MNKQLNMIIPALLMANATRPWELVEPITVRLSPHTAPLHIWGLQVTEKRQLIVKTVDLIGGHPEPFWNELKGTDINADKVIGSIYQRVMMVYKDVNLESEIQMYREREQDPFESQVFERENGAA